MVVGNGAAFAAGCPALEPGDMAVGPCSFLVTVFKNNGADDGCGGFKNSKCASSSDIRDCFYVEYILRSKGNNGNSSPQSQQDKNLQKGMPQGRRLNKRVLI